jgi:hypothetical protein
MWIHAHYVDIARYMSDRQPAESRATTSARKGGAVEESSASHPTVVSRLFKG